MKLLFTLCLLLLSLNTSAGPVDTYVFDNDVDRIRYQALVKELRCPKCQNQNLSGSNSQIAIDLRRQVYEMINQDKADSEIIHYMVERYGEFVLYRPQVSKLTYILWFGPIVFVGIGIIVLCLLLRKKTAKNAEDMLSEEQQQKLANILKDK